MKDLDPDDGMFMSDPRNEINGSDERRAGGESFPQENAKSGVDETVSEAQAPKYSGWGCTVFLILVAIIRYTCS